MKISSVIQSYCISPKVYESLNIPQQTQNSEQKPYTAMLIIWHFLILSMKTSFPSIGWGWSGWQCEYVNTSKAIRNLGLHKLQETSFLLLLLSNWTPAGRRVPQNHVFDWLIFPSTSHEAIWSLPLDNSEYFTIIVFYGCAISLRILLMWLASLAGIVGFIAFRRSWQINYFCSILILLCSLIRRGKLKLQWIFGPWNMQKCKCKYPAGRSFIMLNLSA